MRTKSADFLAVVEGGEMRLSDDPESFPHTKFACFGDWVVRLSSIQNFPIHFDSGSSRLALPYVSAQNSLMLVVGIVKRAVVLSPPWLEVGGAAHVLLHLLLPVHLGLHHLSLVDHVLCQALALEWAFADLPQLPLRAVTGGWRRLLLQRAPAWLDVGQEFPIVRGDDLLHVRAGGVGELEV